MGPWFASMTLGFGVLTAGLLSENPAPPPPVDATVPTTEIDPDDIHVNLEMDVLFVEFDVSVHDKKGKFIPGVPQERFHLFEDGKEVEISSFEEVLQKAPEFPVDGAPQASGRSFLVFVDTYLASTPKIMQAKRELAKFLETSVTPGDTISLAILEPWGTLAVHPSLQQSDAADVARHIALPMARVSSPLSNSYEDARHVLTQVEEAVTEVLGSPVPAPKSLIFISAGFVPSKPEDPMTSEDVAGMIEQFAPQIAPPHSGFDPLNPERSRNFRGKVRPVHDAPRADDLPRIEALVNSLAGWLAARNIALYSINCGDYGPLDLFRAFDTDEGIPSMNSAEVMESRKLNMLRDLAELTGGLAWLSSRGFKNAFYHIDQATASVYRIGFRPDTDRARGRYHKLKVTVHHDQKVKVRYPRGYLDS